VVRQAHHAGVKEQLADFAFETWEIAAYNSLIALAGRAGQRPAVAILRPTLAEEEAMAKWLSEHLAPTTEKYVTLRAEGRTARH
jgi:ferritin-like metal-binding protein YciE